MRRTPEVEAWLRARLQEAVDKFAKGSADEFGRLIGYRNGGSVRQSLGGDRRVQPAILERAETVESLNGWFAIPSELLPDTADNNIAVSSTGMFSDDLKKALQSRGSKEVLKAENMLRVMLGMDPIVDIGNDREAS
jgi:hypothetical protein